MVDLFPLEDFAHIHSPRRVMQYLLIWCSAGEATLVVDESEFILRENEVITITSGQVHFMKKWEAAQGFALGFSLDFFCKDDTDIELIFHNGLFCHFAQNEVVSVPDRPTVEQLFSKIRTDLDHQPYQYLIAVHACLELLLVAINRAKIDRGDEIWKPDALFLKFLEAVRANFRDHPTLSFFAQKLQTTELKLNELAKLFTGKTAQMVMDGLVASEAKRLLTYEKLSVKEVAAALGFADPFYFSNFFKKKVGISPKGWREKSGF